MSSSVPIVESLESRSLLSVSVFSGIEPVDSGHTIAQGDYAHLDFGFIRQDDPGEARSITYNLLNKTGATLKLTAVTVPTGFKILSIPSGSTALLADDDTQNLVVQMDKTIPGHHQGNIVINSSDGGQVFFEITGTVGQYAAPGANNLGTLGSGHRTDSIFYHSLTDNSGSAILTPGANLYRFDLAAPHNNVTLNLIKPAASDYTAVNMNIYRDANADGILQVAEEQEIFPPIHVDGISGGSLSDSASAALSAGAFLIKCSPPNAFLGDSDTTVAYDFTIAATAQPDSKIQVQAAGKTAITDNDLTPSTTDGTDFGPAAAGSIARRDFVITNTGNAPLQLNPSAFFTSNNGFAIDAGLPSSIAPGGTARLGILLLTTSAGNKSAQVVIPTNDPRAPQFNFNVSGSVATPGATPPAATLLTALRVRTTGGAFYKFTIRYTDSDGVDASTIDSDDITVTGTGGFSSPVRLLSMTTSHKGQTVDAFYRLAARGGTWDRGDNGLYTFNLGDNQIIDLSGNPTAATAVGQFTVRIPKTSTPAAIAGHVFSKKFIDDQELTEPVFGR